MVVYRASDRRVVTLDHRERAPRRFAPTTFQERDGIPIPFSDLQTSGLAFGVPGTVLGWEDALRRYGRMTLSEALEPAIEIAADGFPVDAAFAEHLTENLDRFALIATTRDLYLTPDGRALPVGVTFRNPGLAEAYRLIARFGAREFYRGRIARAMVAIAGDPPPAPGATRRVRPSVMTLDDLAAYAVAERPPVRTSYRGRTIYGMDLPAGGPVVGLVLNILEGFPMASLPKAEALHCYLEASRLAFADREAYLGDPDHVHAPASHLLSGDHAAARRALIGRRAHASAPETAAAPRGGDAVSRDGGSADRKRSSTTHLTVLDRERNIVSYTFSIGSTGGSAIVVPEFGFLLNSELTDFDPAPDHPNCPGSGKRPRSSMSPTIILNGSRPVAAIGSPGGTAIIGSVLQTIINILDFGLTLPEAIAAPRLFQHNTPATRAEREFLDSTDARALEAMGHTLVQTSPMGEIAGVTIDEQGVVTAAAEPVRRGGGSARVEERLEEHL
jgi:gamma-glutamyltranspeptidase/glutathione hydrolase